MNKGLKNRLALMTLLFIGWSSVFIYQSSFITIDGSRYFCLFDDAMISMRYAWNLSHGFGLIWNTGEKVEGFTNMLMTLYMSLLNLIFDKKYAVLAVQISGIVFLLITAYFFMKIAEQHLKKDEPNRHLILTLAFLAPLTYYPLIYWTLMGMENGMLAALIAITIYFCFRVPDKFCFIIPFLLGLAFLTRPDTAIAIAVILLFRGYGLIKMNKFSIIIYESLIVGLFVLGIGFFRLSYYGSVFPNTYTLKMIGLDIGIRIIDNGLNFILPFLDSISILLFLSLLAIILRLNQYYVFFITLFIAIVGYQIYIGGDAWLYWRQMALYVPYLYLIIIFDLNQLTKMSPLSYLKNRKLQMMTITGLVCLIILLSNQGFYRELFLLQPPYQTAANQRNVNIALSLNQLLKPSASIAVFWAGAIPYFTGLKTIDMLGKSDKYIAALPPDVSGATAWNGLKSVPGHNKYDLNYSIIEKKPTYIQGYKWGQQDLTEFVSHHYVNVTVNNRLLFFFLKNSPEVNWNQLNLITP